MGSFGKFLLTTVVATAAAAGLYYYLDKTAQETARERGDEEPAPRPFDKENIQRAADRAYTQIKHGTEETWATLRDTVAPEVVNTVKDAAAGIRNSVSGADAGEEEDAYSEEDTDFAQDQADTPEETASAEEPDAAGMTESTDEGDAAASAENDSSSASEEAGSAEREEAPSVDESSYTTIPIKSGEHREEAKDIPAGPEGAAAAKPVDSTMTEDAKPADPVKPAGSSDQEMTAAEDASKVEEFFDDDSQTS